MKFDETITFLITVCSEIEDIRLKEKHLEILERIEEFRIFLKIKESEINQILQERSQR